MTIVEILRRAIATETPSESLAPIAVENWSEIYKAAAKQGVFAIVYDYVKSLPTAEQPPKGLKLQWALNAERIEKRYHKQSALAGELAEIYASENITTLVLKGLAISKYYPIADHRECGDLDCFLAKSDSNQPYGIALRENGIPQSCYAAGNTIAKQAGAKVEIGFYKHSHINFRGLVVENHAFCTAVRGSRNNKRFERHLQQLLATRPTTPIGQSRLLSPCADFNALFLTAHSFQHFITEGIKLRHVLDWALLLRAEQHNIDWQSFYAWCDTMHFTKFADAMTAIAVDKLGIEISNPDIRTSSKLRDKVLDDILYSEKKVSGTKGSKFTKRLKIIRNRLLGGWKYKELYERSAFVDTMQMVVAFFIERNPKI